MVVENLDTFPLIIHPSFVFFYILPNFFGQGYSYCHPVMMMMIMIQVSSTLVSLSSLFTKTQQGSKFTYCFVMNFSIAEVVVKSIQHVTLHTAT